LLARVRARLRRDGNRGLGEAEAGPIREVVRSGC